MNLIVVTVKISYSLMYFFKNFSRTGNFLTTFLKWI